MESEERMRGGIAVLVLLAVFAVVHPCDAQPPITPTVSSPIHDTTRAQPAVVDPGPYARVSRARAHQRRPPCVAHPDRLPIALQDHESPVRFRNIWVRDLER